MADDIHRPTGDWRSLAVFHCHMCGDVHELPVDERTSRLLSGAGVVLEVPAMLPTTATISSSTLPRLTWDRLARSPVGTL